MLRTLDSLYSSQKLTDRIVIWPSCRSKHGGHGHRFATPLLIVLLGNRRWPESLPAAQDGISRVKVEFEAYQKSRKDARL